MNYHTRWYHYMIVLLFYLIVFVITSSFIYNFTLDQWYSIYLRISISAVFLFTVIMILMAHTHAMISNNAIEEVTVITPDKNKVPDCPKCLSDRPQRSHHCQVCNVCIKRMDHHCPWIANCVGEFNQKSFLLLLFYSILGSFIAFLCTMQSFIRIVSIERDISLLVNNIRFMANNNSLRITLVDLFTLLGFILSGLMGISICILLYIQVNELRSGMTAIELKIYPKNDECPYYNYNLKTNFISLFGSNVLLWFFPVNTSNQDSNNELNNNYIALN